MDSQYKGPITQKSFRCHSIIIRNVNTPNNNAPLVPHWVQWLMYVSVNLIIQPGHIFAHVAVTCVQLRHVCEVGTACISVTTKSVMCIKQGFYWCLPVKQRWQTSINDSHESHDDVINWKHFPRCWPFVRGIHRSPVNSPHKGQWRGALIFSLGCV